MVSGQWLVNRQIAKPQAAIRHFSPLSVPCNLSPVTCNLVLPVGRRALPKIDPSLDVASRLKTFDELPRPWDAAALFGRTVPLEIEVGSGKGLFLRSAATAWPDTNFLGIEVSHKYARFAAAGLVKRA